MSREPSAWQPGSTPLHAKDLAFTFVAGKVAVVHFWAIWNNYDRVYDAELAPLRLEYADRIQFFAVDTDDADLHAFCHECQFANLPALAFFAGNRRTKTIVGGRTIDVLRTEFESLLNAT